VIPTSQNLMLNKDVVLEKALQLAQQKDTVTVVLK
jgi:hypothetical protein